MDHALVGAYAAQADRVVTDWLTEHFTPAR
jgi:hypothetical protein